jgi:serine/threonine protein kinase
MSSGFFAIWLTRRFSGASNYITPLLGHFYHTGPNGKHLCLVLEPMGGNTNHLVEEVPSIWPQKPDRTENRYPLWMAKLVLREVLESLAFLHAQGVAHGDLRPQHMLFALEDLHDVPEDELKTDVDNNPRRSISPPVKRLDGKEDWWAPEYLAVPQSLYEYTNFARGFKVRLCDFGDGKCSLL